MSDIEKIRSIPWELPEGLQPPSDGGFPASFAERGILHTAVSSPFVCVAGMMPYEMFLELCVSERNLVRELTEECHARISEVLNVLLEDKRIECVWMGGSEWLTPPMAAKELYSDLVQPYERVLIGRIHEAGALAHIHCHGNVRSTLELVIQRGADYFEPLEPPPDGDISFVEAKALARGRITLGGNVEFRVLQNEGETTVEDATRRAFDGGRTRMVLQATEGPLAPIDANLARNYHRLIDVWEDLSPLA